ncbi:MAG: hypothetical protein L0I70_13645, partial [Lactococcus lactis]|nr:hypothetical protein [Lactococcus lactis]
TTYKESWENTYKQFTTDKHCLLSFSQETSISKLILIDNYFPDLIETSTFMLYDVQQIAIAFYPKIKKYQHNLIPYVSY